MFKADDGKYKLTDLYRRWAKEEGLDLPKIIGTDLGLNSKSKQFKINSQKFLVSELLKYYKVPCIENFLLDDDLTIATMQAERYFDNYKGEIVIRGNRGAGGFETFFPDRKSQLKMMISTLHHHPKGRISALVSPRVKPGEEISVFVLNGKIEMSICKEYNDATKTNNLSTGSSARPVYDEQLIEKLQKIVDNVIEIIPFVFARFDFLLDGEYKVLELSVPNYKSFALQNAECDHLGKILFLKAYKLAFNELSR